MSTGNNRYSIGKKTRVFGVITIILLLIGTLHFLWKLDNRNNVDNDGSSKINIFQSPIGKNEEYQTILSAVGSLHGPRIKNGSNGDSNSRIVLKIKEHDGNSAVRCSWLYYYIQDFNGSQISDPLSSNGKVYGRVTFYDRYAVGDKYRPVGGLFLNAYDIDGSQPYDFPYINPSDMGGPTSDWDRLGWTLTNQLGIFELEFNNTDGWWGGYGKQDVFIHFFTNISGVCIIENTSGYVYQYRMWDDVPNVPSGDAVTIWVNGTPIDTDIYANDRTLDENQWRYRNDDNKIITYILSGPLADICVVIKLAHDFMLNTASVDPPTAVIYYPTDADHAFYNPDDGRIYVPNVDTINYTELLMAYGQFLLDTYADLGPPNFDVDYAFELHQNTTTAWVNGWSLFFAETVKDYWNNYYLYYGSFQRIDLEPVYDEDGFKNDSDVIRAVAGILWDIVDGNDDDQDGDGIGDHLDYSFSNIWSVITNYKPWDIFDFVDGFIQEYSVNSTDVWELCWENGVNIDEAPPTRPSVLDYLPDINLWKNQSWVWVKWSQCYDQDQKSLLAGYKIYVKDKNNVTRKIFIYNTTQNEANISLGSGVWYLYITSFDRAGNENATILGKFMLDVMLPAFYRIYPYDGTTIFDNSTGSIVLKIDWFDSPSGVYYVYIRYKFGDTGQWSDWIQASYDGTRFYYIVIDSATWKDPSVWGNETRITLYWESKCIDFAGNRANSNMYKVILVDDDSSPPVVTYPSSPLLVFDNTWDNYTIWVKMDDPSGIYNVTFIVWFENTEFLFTNDSIYRNGSIFYVVIPPSIWKNYVRCKVYITIYAWDNDTDRIGDRALKFSDKREIGEVMDDDNDPPVILNIEVYEDPLGGDGRIETDERIYLVIIVYDKSGVDGFVQVILGSENFTILASVEYQSNYTYRLVTEMFGPILLGESLSIRVWDNDTDEPGDKTYREVSLDDLEVVLENTEIIIDLDEIQVNYTSSYNLSFEIKRNDGGVVPLDNLTIYVYVKYGGTIVGVLNTTTYSYNETNAIAYIIISPYLINISRGIYDLVISFGGSENFAASNYTLWMHVWMDTATYISSPSNVSYGERINVAAYVYDSTGEPVEGVLVVFFVVDDADGNVSRIKIGENYTDANGRAVLYWLVNINAGTYTLEAIFSGDELEHLYSSKNSSVVLIMRTQLLVIINENITLTYTDGGIIRLLIQDAFGNAAQNVNVSIYLVVNDSEEFLGSNTTDFNGVFELKIASYGGIEYPTYLVPGTYLMHIYVSGDERFIGTNTSTELIVAGDDIGVLEVAVNSSFIEWGDILDIRMMVYDDDGEPLTIGNVSIRVLLENGSPYLELMIPITNGYAEISLNFSDLCPVQILNMYVNATSIWYEGSVYKLTRLYLIREELVVSTNIGNEWIWEVTYNESDTLILSVRDNDGSGVLPLGFIQVYLDDNLIMNTTLASTLAINYPPPPFDLLPGVYTIRVLLNSRYYELTEDIIITLKVETLGLELEVDAAVLTVEYGDNVSFIARVLTMDGDPLSFVSVIVLIPTPNETIVAYNGYTNESGYVLISFTIDIPPGNYTVKINAIGSIEYGKTTRNIGLVVYREEVSIKIELSEKPKVGEEVIISIDIMDDDEDAVVNVPIEVYVDDSLLLNTTYIGHLEVSWYPDSGGKHVLRVRIRENSYYIATEQTLEVDVEASRKVARSWMMPLIILLLVSILGSLRILGKKLKSSSTIEDIVEEASEETIDEELDV